MKVLSGDASDKETVGIPSLGARGRGDVPAIERRRLLAQQLQEQREDEVLDLHTRRNAHYIDNAFSLVTANLAVVSLVLGCVYMSRECEKPLAGFLIVLGLLAPFAACLPVLLRQWFYLHLRLNNVITVIVLVASAVYLAWLLVGQRWAFASSSKTCDQDLATATNVVVFVLYVMVLVYAAKVVWYLLVRVRYSYRQLILSCFRDPYPNVLAMSEHELDQLDADLDRPPAQDDEERKPKVNKNRTLLSLQRHQHELRQSLHHFLRSSPTVDATAKPVITPKSKPKNWTLDFTKPRHSTSKRSHVASVTPIHKPSQLTSLAAAAAERTDHE
jgi:hypothetical protein